MGFHKDHHQKRGNDIPRVTKMLGKCHFWVASWCFFQNRRPYATILAPRGSKGGPGSILSRISVSFGGHFESLGASSALFFRMFFEYFVESIFGGVLFGPGPDFEWFWDAFWSPLGAIFCYWMTFAGSGDLLFLNNAMVV